jgi:hypothetical protein
MRIGIRGVALCATPLESKKGVLEMERYTKLHVGGQAYLDLSKLRVSQNGEVAGDAIQSFALYEATGYDSAELLALMKELESYRDIGFTPVQLSRIFNQSERGEKIFERKKLR